MGLSTAPGAGLPGFEYRLSLMNNFKQCLLTIAEGNKGCVTVVSEYWMQTRI